MNIQNIAKGNGPYSSFRLEVRLWGQNDKSYITLMSQQVRLSRLKDELNMLKEIS